MAILTGYFNSLNGDRKYNAETMSMYFSGLFTRGVLQNYKDKFAVKSKGGMKIEVPTGKAYFSDGKWIENTAPIIFNLDPSDVVLNRIDSIVLRKDKNETVRNTTIVVKKGTPSSNPIAPATQNDDYVEELLLCEIRVNKLVENITQANITNRIPDTKVCGYVTAIIEQVDTHDLYMQYEAAYKEFYANSQKEFNDWFNNLKENLSTSTLLRQYTNKVITSAQNQTVIDIGIPQYNPVLDILEVFVNGVYIIEGRKEGQSYTKTEKQITLSLPLDSNQEVCFTVFKSIDGEKATTVIEQVEELQEQKADKKIYEVLLNPSEWVLKKEDNYYHLNAPVTGVGANDILIVSPAPESVEKYGGVIANSQSPGYIDFKAKVKPSDILHVNVVNLGTGVLQ